MALVERRTRLEDRPRDQACLPSQSVTPKARRSDGAIVRPYRTVVIAARVVIDGVARERANPPTRKEFGGNKSRSDSPRAGRREDSAPEAVSGVGGQGFDLPFASVKALRHKALSCHPEVPAELSPQVRGGSL